MHFLPEVFSKVNTSYYRGFKSNEMNQSNVNFASAVGKFNGIDYTTFGALLGSSLAVGIYYGCIKKNQNTTSEYMFGGKSMSVFPIVASLVIRFVHTW